MRWWDHGFRGEEVGRVLFEVILGGEDILTLVVSMVSGFLCTRFVFGEAARVQLGMRLVLLTLSSPLWWLLLLVFNTLMLLNLESPDIWPLASEMDLSSAEDARRCAGHCRRVRVGPIR